MNDNNSYAINNTVKVIVNEVNKADTNLFDIDFTDSVCTISIQWDGSKTIKDVLDDEATMIASVQNALVREFNTYGSVLETPFDKLAGYSYMKHFAGILFNRVDEFMFNLTITPLDYIIETDSNFEGKWDKMTLPEVEEETAQKHQ